MCESFVSEEGKTNTHPIKLYLLKKTTQSKPRDFIINENLTSTLLRIIIY
jgi:hypothetical protein